jgi:hypothetical protein
MTRGEKENEKEKEKQNKKQKKKTKNRQNEQIKETTSKKKQVNDQPPFRRDFNQKKNFPITQQISVQVKERTVHRGRIATRLMHCKCD